MLVSQPAYDEEGLPDMQNPEVGTVTRMTSEILSMIWKLPILKWKKVLKLPVPNLRKPSLMRRISRIALSLKTLKPLTVLTSLGTPLRRPK
jgi:hypothetical protein